MYRRFDAQNVCDMLFRVGIIDVACNIQDIGDGEFSFSDLEWCRPDITARGLKNLVAVGMIRHNSDTPKMGYYEVAESPLWEFLEGVKTACSQHDRRQKMAFKNEPPLTHEEWLRVRDWFETGGRQLMSGGSLLIYLFEALSGTFLRNRLIPISHHVPRDERRYWMSVNPVAHKSLLWEGAAMIYPIGHTKKYFLDCEWRRQPSPFWPAIASLKDAILNT